MKTPFTSLKGAINLSVVAMLSYIAYTFLQAFFFLGKWNPTTIAAAVQALVVVTIIGGWIWGLLAATEGSRRGLIAALAI